MSGRGFSVDEALEYVANIPCEEGEVQGLAWLISKLPPGSYIYGGSAFIADEIARVEKELEEEP